MDTFLKLRPGFFFDRDVFLCGGFRGFAEGFSRMHMFREIFLLFSLNLLDALLTIVWVRTGVATEANHLMARLLDIGDLTFLGAKLVIGTITALVLFKCANLKLARYGLSVALAVYISLMGIHLFTGLTAFGYISSSSFNELSKLPNIFFAFFA